MAEEVVIKLRTDGASQVNDDLKRISEQITRTAQSTGQQAQAMRMLGPQITDIVTGLASGQNPMMVLIQQGGQLRDMFGSVGGAIKGVLSVFTPLRVAIGGVAAVAGGLALAYKQGAEESDGFARALIMSGNAAGVTAGQLALMRNGISEVVGTRGAAAEALTALAAGGNVAGEQMQRAAEIAVRFARLGVQSVEKTAQAFNELGKDPVAASKRLDDQMRYLTVSTYAQIKAAQEQGRVTDAARLAQTAYADASAAAIAKLEARLGTFERAWQGLSGWAKKAWDEILGIGREQTAEERLATLGAKVQDLGTRQRDALGRTRSGQAIPDDLREQRRMGQAAVAAGQASAADAAANAKQVEAYQRLEGTLLSLRSRAEQYRIALQNLRNEAATAKLPADELRRAEAQLAQQYDPGTTMAGIEARTSLAAEKIKGRLREISDAVKSGSMDAITANRAAEQADLDAIAVQRQKIEQELAYQKERSDSEAAQIRLRGQLVVLDEQEAQRRAEGAREEQRINDERERGLALSIAQRRQQERNADNEAANRAAQENVQSDLAKWSGIINATQTRQIEQQARERAALTERFQAGAFGDISDPVNKKAFEEAFRSIGAGLDTLDNRMQAVTDNFRENWIKTGSLSGQGFVDAFMQEVRRGIYDKFLAGTIKESVGSLTGFIGDILGFGSHAEGLSYVPRDNYIARLHRGERVLTAEENKNGARGGQAINVVQNFTVGDVATLDTVRQAVRGSEARMAAALARSQRFGGAMA